MEKYVYSCLEAARYRAYIEGPKREQQHQSIIRDAMYSPVNLMKLKFLLSQGRNIPIVRLLLPPPLKVYASGFHNPLNLPN